MELIAPSQIPQEVIESIACHLVNFSLGFVKVEQTPHGESAILAGSGTLVKVGQMHAILTAHHVITELPRRGSLGFVLYGHRARFVVEAQSLQFIEVARGTVDRDGPDIGAVILSPEIAGSLGAKKCFFNLQNPAMSDSPPSLNHGIWALLGFVAEKTTQGAGMGRYHMLMRFVEVVLTGDVGQSYAKDGHDYLDFTFELGGSAVPRDLKGMSGGGLWQVSLKRDAKGQLTHKQAFLSGVAFYQRQIEGNHSEIRCHGRRSIYDVLYEALTNG
jgi:hypothetical protein